MKCLYNMGLKKYNTEEERLEAKRLANKKYRENNKGKIKNKNIKYITENKEKIKENSKKYYEKNKILIKDKYDKSKELNKQEKLKELWKPTRYKSAKSKSTGLQNSFKN